MDSQPRSDRADDGVSLGDTLVAPGSRVHGKASVLGVPVTYTATPRPRPSGSHIPFGHYLTDHVLIAEHEAASGWQLPHIVPAGTPHAEIASGAIQYGLSIFEGLKAFKSPSGEIRIFRPDAHARRFAASASRLCMPEIAVDSFMSAVRAIVRVDADWCPPHNGGAIYVRPTLHGSEAFLGVRPAAKHTFSVILSPVDSYFEGDDHKLRLWAEREYTRAALGGVGAVKTGGNYACSLLAAKRAKENGFDQVMWLDAHKHEYLEEAGTMNVFVRIGDTVITPPLGGTILAGVTRDSCLMLLRSWGTRVDERPVSLTELAESARSGKEIEMWGTGTAAVVSPISELAWDSGSVKSTGSSIAPRLREALDGIHSGRNEDPFGWLVTI
ncbi:MAG: branched-chain amino acid aminotransferase [Polyangiaceae bacterium]|nr:branched-chain amino acid aminotransferase [Polyangiaceae bacterium]